MRRPSWPVAPPGKRGEVLILLGLLWILLGISDYLVSPRSDELLYLLIPAPLRLVLWAGSGLVAIGYAWMPRTRSDAPGFVILYVMAAVRFTSYLLAWVDYSLDGEGGYKHGWIMAAINATFMGLIAVCASWRENPRGNVGEAGR